MDAIEISRTGLDVEWQRLQVIAQNLANRNSIGTTPGEVQRPMRLVSGPGADFAKMVDGAPLKGTRVLGVEPMAGGVRRTYQPDDPRADADGFVAAPEMDHSAEMVLLVKTSRVYEANLTAMAIAQQMYARAAEIGRQS